MLTPPTGVSTGSPHPPDRHPTSETDKQDLPAPRAPTGAPTALPSSPLPSASLPRAPPAELATATPQPHLRLRERTGRVCPATKPASPASLRGALLPRAGTWSPRWSGPCAGCSQRLSALPAAQNAECSPGSVLGTEEMTVMPTARPSDGGQRAQIPPHLPAVRPLSPPLCLERHMEQPAGILHSHFPRGSPPS